MSLSPSSRFLRTLIRGLAALILWPLFLPKREGRPWMPEGEGGLLLANHHSLLDPILITYFYKSERLSFVAKKELFNIFAIGRILRAFRSIPLDRETADVRATKLILAMIKEGQVVGLFPQGTRVSLEEPTSMTPHAPMLYYAIRRGIPIMFTAVDPRYRLFGRPRFIFADPVRPKLSGGLLSREEQEGVAWELMRRIYAIAGLDYEYEGRERWQSFFDQRIQLVPIPREEDH